VIATTKHQGQIAKRVSLIVLAAICLLLVVAVVAALKLENLHMYKIPSASMEPTIDEGDRIAVDETYYVHHTIADGDLVTFRHGENMLVKRVVALAGDTIEGRDGVLFRNGAALREPYALFSPNNPIPEIETFESRKIPVGQIFVAGDNRDKSLDSRATEFGPVFLKDVVGKVKFIYYSRHAGQIGRGF